MRQQWLVTILGIMLTVYLCQRWYENGGRTQVTRVGRDWKRKNKDSILIPSNEKVEAEIEAQSEPPPPKPQPTVEPTPSDTSLRYKYVEPIPRDIYVDFVTIKGVITIHLLPEKAPKSVKNFLEQCLPPYWNPKANPFYAGLKFYRTVPDYFIQTGSEGNDGAKGTWIYNDTEQNTKPEDIQPGMVVVAKLGNANSKTEFFIALNNMGKLVRGMSTVFGEVVSGLQAAVAISRSKTNVYDNPDIPIFIEKVTVRKIYDEKDQKSQLGSSDDDDEN